MAEFQFNEEYLSQIPALQELIGLGYKYLSPKKALEERGDKTGNVLLEGILREQLAKINRIPYRGEEYFFSDANIQEAIQKLKAVKYDGLQTANEKIYDLITGGTSLEQAVEGNYRSHSLKYIDWDNPANNVFHVVPEYVVERRGSETTIRPDIVLFVNGIPFVVIECKGPDMEVEDAISQTIRNQGNDYAPNLFIYVQLVMAVNKNAAKYATVGTEAKFWSVWKELEDKEAKVKALVNTPLIDAQKSELFSKEFFGELFRTDERAREYFDGLESDGGRLVTEQDKAIYSLCRPERLLELTRRFTVFDGKNRKIARYQQFFVIRSIIARIKEFDADGKRAGGVIWHTQGSGKSLTMVMLTRVLALDISNPRIILVTDRDDLDRQLGSTFVSCGLKKERATSGRNLIRHLENKVDVITTLIHKFDRSWVAEKFADPSPDIFVLVDESHRTNFGELQARMRQVLPNACYLGFTGTPLLKEERNNFAKFGELIEPHYSIRQAVEDKAVLPLRYEGRRVVMEQDQAAIDHWFEKHTAGLSDKQKADLKRKYARAKELNIADQVIYRVALDISEHYRDNWQGTGFKAQLVAPNKAAAVKYDEHLKEIGFVNSEVIISAPDTQEGHEEVNKGPTGAVGKFWIKMMKRFGTEEQYTKQIIDNFKEGEKPEILIVVDKLLTGFDAPKNTVLYLCRPLREHTLLQAIARVNRLEKGKEFGYIIDYAGMLSELDKALNMYEAFAGFEPEDIIGALTSVSEEVKQLGQHHSNLQGMFREVGNQRDEEAFEVFLADKERRDDFYERLSRYSKTLGLALSTVKFITETEDKKIREYKDDLKRFHKLRVSVKIRYADAIDYRDYEPKIKKLLDTHIQANEIIQLNEPIDILDEKNFAEAKQGTGIHKARTEAARADAIAHATKRVIHEKMEEDPAFYQKFSDLIQKVIDGFRDHTISETVYLDQAIDIRNKVNARHHEDVPDSISGNDVACAYYGAILDIMKPEAEDEKSKDVAATASLAVQRIIKAHWKVDFWTDEGAQRTTRRDIDDFLYDVVRSEHGVEMISEQHDEIIAQTMRIAMSRSITR